MTVAPEPLDGWWYWAARAGSIVALADSLVDGDRRAALAPATSLVADHRWVIMGDLPLGLEADAARQFGEGLAASHAAHWTQSPEPRRPGVRPLIADRSRWPAILADAVEEWATLADLRPTVELRGPRIVPEMTHRDLFGLLGRLLILTISRPPVPLPDRAVSWPRCVACGEVFDRWQRGGPARYCWECNQNGAPQRRAEAARQERLRAGTPKLPRGRRVALLSRGDPSA